ncbi:MAG: oligosaccharide flippase family protein [Beijerinckiaceae bacterium]
MHYRKTEATLMALPRFARNTLNSTLAGASTALGAFLSVVVVARLLGPDGAGSVALAIWLIGTLVTICDLGLPMTVARFLPDLNARAQKDEATRFAPAFFLPLLATTALGVAICVFVSLFRPQVEAVLPITPFDNLPNHVWLGLAFLFAMQAIGNYGLGELRGRQRFDEAARLSSVSFAIQIVGVGLGAWFFGVTGAIIGYGGGSLLLAAHALRNIGYGGVVDPELRARAWRFSLASWGVGLIAAIVWSRTELAFLSHFRSPREAGLYAVANTLAQVATQAPLLMTGGLLAHFAERHAIGDQEGLKRAFESAVRFMALVTFPACFGMAALAPSLVPALFGWNFAEASGPAAVLVAAQAFGAVSAVSSALLFAAERNYVLVWTGALGAIAVLVSGFTIIPQYGLDGAVYARSAIQFAIVAASFIYIGQRLDCPTPYASVVRIMLAAAGCGFAAREIVITFPGWLGIALGVFTGALVYLALVRLLRALPQEDVGRVLDVVGKMPSWISPVLSPLVQFFER